MQIWSQNFIDFWYFPKFRDFGKQNLMEPFQHNKQTNEQTKAIVSSMAFSQSDAFSFFFQCSTHDHQNVLKQTPKR